MVKTKALIAYCVRDILADCGLLGRSAAAPSSGSPGTRAREAGSAPYRSCAPGQRSLPCTPDWETTGLYSVQIPVADSLPAAAPVAKMIDKIDMTFAAVSPSFGEHVALARGDTVSVLYLGRESERTSPFSSLPPVTSAHPQWNLDVIEPYG